MKQFQAQDSRYCGVLFPAPKYHLFTGYRCILPFGHPGEHMTFHEFRHSIVTAKWKFGQEPVITKKDGGWG